MSRIRNILSAFFKKDTDSKPHMTGSAGAMSNLPEQFVHCGCMDGDEIHEVSVYETFHGPPRKRKMCMFHIEKEMDNGKIVSFD